MFSFYIRSVHTRVRRITTVYIRSVGNLIRSIHTHIRRAYFVYIRSVGNHIRRVELLQQRN